MIYKSEIYIEHSNKTILINISNIILSITGLLEMHIQLRKHNENIPFFKFYTIIYTLQK